MPIHIQTVVEKQRGCGFKKPGGLYLIGGASSSSCCRLPFPLTVCSCCGQGVKFSRGFTWINTDLFNAHAMNTCELKETNCIMTLRNLRIGLMWVGESFYKTPQHFINEAWHLGISKRISQLPKDCEPGKTWIALAHRKCITEFSAGAEFKMVPGVFMIFKLTAVQYVVNGKETEQELQKLQDKGIDLIRVKREGQQQTINI